MSVPRPFWLRAAAWPARRAWRALDQLRRGRWYGLPRPAWWPRERAWPLGPSHRHDGREVTLFILGQRCVFTPVTYGRYRGHVFAGRLRPTVERLAAGLEAAGLEASRARLLWAVSSLEGGFDSFQTYDRARVSWGFIQFAGTGGLPALLARLAREAPAAFEQYFGSAGLEAEPGQLSVRIGERRLRGWRALNHIHGEPALWAAFVQAAHDPRVQDIQVRAAYEHYLLRAQALTMTVGQRAHRLGDLFAGNPLGEAMLFDRAVANGLAHTQRAFQRAAQHAGLHGPDAADRLLAAVQQVSPAYQVRWQALTRALAAANSRPDLINGDPTSHGTTLHI